jgi:toxin ParE1/3/4
MTAVVFSELAEADLTDIWVFISQDNAEAAGRFIEQIHESCQRLARTPKAGRLRPELSASLRSLTVGSYIVFYREGANSVEIARVLHGHRDISSFFRA